MTKQTEDYIFNYDGIYDYELKIKLNLLLLKKEIIKKVIANNIIELDTPRIFENLYHLQYIEMKNVKKITDNYLIIVNCPLLRINNINMQHITILPQWMIK